MKPLVTGRGLFSGVGGGSALGTFFRISSYKSRIKSSLKRPNVEQAMIKPERFGCSMANWHTFRAKRSFGVIRFSTLEVKQSHSNIP